ncbi:S8 family serine peptidase [Sphingomonas oligophenolica]
MRRSIAGAIATALLVFALLLPVARARAEGPPPADASREILVMLRLAPPHYRPNSGYGGGYGDAQSRAARHRVAQQIAHRNRLELVDGWPMPLLGVDCFVMRLPADMTIDAAIAKVSRDPMVVWSEQMQVYRTQGAQRGEGDPLFAVQPAAAAWRLADLHRVATGRGVTVAVVDSKVEVGHPDLSGQFTAEEDFSGRPSGPAEQHGTGIAGVIAAKAGNGLGIAGIAPGARLMALRACWQTGGATAPGATLCDSLSLAKAIHFAIEHKAQVINLSLSGPPDALLGKLIDIALARNMSVVAAFDPTLPKGGFPASQAGVVAVADEALSSLPSRVYGAPGRDVPTTQPGGRWYLVNGSSYAAAHVSGLLALLREQRRSGGTPKLVSASAGGGIVDACATLVPTSPACGCSCAVARAVAMADRR